MKKLIEDLNNIKPKIPIIEKSKFNFMSNYMISMFFK